MNPIDDGGPAYPCQELNGQGTPNMCMQFGLSMRDVFAMHAMSAIIPGTQLGFRAICDEAYQYADAMLEARKVTP